MKLKKFIVGAILSLAGLATGYAIIQPNIVGWTTITNPDPNNFFTIIQSGSTQGKISMANFANSITGSLGLTDYVPYTGATQDINIGNYNYLGAEVELPFNTNGFYFQSGSTILGFAAYSPSQLYLYDNIAGVNLDISNITEDRQIYFPDATGTILLDTTLTEIDPVWLAASGDYIPRTSVTTGMTYPGSDIIIPSEKSVFDLLDGYAADLGDVLTTGGYYISGINFRRTVEKVNTYAIEYSLDGGNIWLPSAYAGFSGMLDGDGNPYITGLGYMGLTNNYVPFWSGDKLYNTNITYSPNQTYIGDPAEGASISLQSGTSIYLSPDSFGTTFGIFPNSIIFDANSSRMSFDNTGALIRSVAGRVDIQSVSGTYISGDVTVSTGNRIYLSSLWRVGTSGDNLSFQAFTGGVWEEKGFFSP